MEFKEVKAIDSIESKSTQEVEKELLDKHDKELKAQEVNTEEKSVPEEKSVSDTNVNEDQEVIAEQDLPELKDEDVLSYINNRYNKDISSVDDLFESQESNEKLPEDVSKYLKFKKDTGRGFEDFVKANKDYSKLSDDKVLAEYYSLTESDLDAEDIQYLMNDKFGVNEDEDDEREIKTRNIAKKRELAKAKKYLGELSEAYKIPLESSGGSISDDEIKELNAYKEYVRKSQTESDATRKTQEYFSKKTNELFSSEFKGFEFNIGDKKVMFTSGDANEVKSKQADINNFIKKYIGKDGLVSDISGWHKALNAAMNPDKVAQYFYEQGKADAIDNVSKKSKNINMDLRQTPQSKPAEGFKARAVNSDSGRGLRIKSKRNN